MKEKETIIVEENEDVEIEFRTENIKHTNKDTYRFLLKKNSKAFINHIPNQNQSINLKFELEENSQLTFAEIKDVCTTCEETCEFNLNKNNSKLNIITFWAGRGKRTIKINANGENTKTKIVNMILTKSNQEITTKLNGTIEGNNSKIESKTNIISYPNSKIIVDEEIINKANKKTTSSISQKVLKITTTNQSTNRPTNKPNLQEQKSKQKSLQSNLQSKQQKQQKNIIVLLPKLNATGSNSKAEHSALITQLDKKKLFYLQSRGLTERNARAFIIASFIRDGLDKIKDKRIEQMFEPNTYLSTGQINRSKNQ